MTAAELDPWSRDNRGQERRDCHCPRARHQHGTYTAYNADRCRCVECRKSATVMRYENRRRQVYRGWAGDPAFYRSAVGTHRRLQALSAIGWTAPEMGRRLGVSVHQLRKLRGGHYPTIRPETAAAVAALYDLLWDKPQRSNAAMKCIWSATNQGWAPPLAWDDDFIDDPTAEANVHIGYVGYNHINGKYTNDLHTGISPFDPGNSRAFIDETAVTEAIAGRPVRLTRHERSEAVRRLTDMGISAAEIAVRLGIPTRQVTRDRARSRDVAA